jgi:catechol 2,3-dioxygenase-like lactoylglutathione lyase family enzyme
MTSVQESTQRPSQGANIDLILEVVVIPVSDVDLAKDFYAGLGWRLDADFATGPDSRIVQFTPPGSGCSVQFGKGITAAAPGSTQGLYLKVSDIEGARETLLARGAKMSEVFHCSAGFVCRFEGPAAAEGRVSGPHPAHDSYSSFAVFQDPDGNGWILQEVTTRLAGRTNPDVTAFTSASDLSAALKRAAAAHGQHEARIGQADPDWPTWYAEYMVREHSGQELPV